MKKRIFSLLTVLALVVTLFSGIVTTHAVTYAELAAYWAPQIYQDVNDTYGYRADFITNFNYDGDYNALNNWNNLNNYYENGYVYYKVAETSTHYFIEYDVFHARDDALTAPLDAHENDLEGLIEVITKDGSTYGSFLLLETLAHNQWYDYTNNPYIYDGSDNVDGGVLFNGSHPKVFCQSNGQSPAGGHGVFAYDGTSAPGGDGIVYNYTGTAQYPSDATGSYTHSYGYALIDWSDLWSRRADYTNIFYSWGVFKGDDNTSNSACAPWGWDDTGDGPTYKGMNFSDPAHQIDVHLNGLGTFSHNYVSYSFFSHKIVLVNVQSMADRDPFGGASDMFVKAFVNGDEQCDARVWKKSDAPMYTTYSIVFGQYDSEFGANFSSSYNTLFVARPSNTNVEIHVYDSDDSSGNDDMGYVSAYITAGNTQTWSNVVTSNSQAKVSATVYTIN